jgi:adenosylcobinamide amidohydrolase
MNHALPVFDSPFALVSRQGRHVVAELRMSAKVLSTCPVNGGLRTDIRHLVNHQSCEPVRHQERFAYITGLGPDGYHGAVCSELGLEYSTTAVMGTAAAMQYLGISTHSFSDLAITAIVTGGVTGNAGSAGDPAHYDEADGRWVRTSPAPDSAKQPGTHGGTINTLLLCSAPLSDTALARAAMTMTEAKTSALLELAVGSKTSWRPATGTGTDQFAIAAPVSGSPLRSWTGKHTKAGELIGTTVREATLEALRWNNGMEPSYTRSLFHALGRFGLDEEGLKSRVSEYLEPVAFQLFKDNWNPVVYEPLTAAAAYSLAAVLDRTIAGTIAPATAREALINQAALIATGLATRPEDFAELRAALMQALPTGLTAAPAMLLPAAIDLVARALALGWQAKWKK